LEAIAGMIQGIVKCRLSVKTAAQCLFFCLCGGQRVDTECIRDVRYTYWAAILRWVGMTYG
jgi:hypothetical protein